MPKERYKIYQAPDRTITIGNWDIAPPYKLVIDEDDFFQSDKDCVNMSMYYLHKFAQTFEHMSPNMKQYCSPFIGEMLKQICCKRDLNLIIREAGGKVREV